jgi:hypothetical protein
VLHFFGLSSQDRERVLEEMFFLMKNINIDYASIRAMPISYRSWFINKIVSMQKTLEAKDQFGLDSDTPIRSIE